MFKYREEFAYPHCVCYNVTDNCNLACKYCFVQQKPHYMSLDVAKAGIDFLINNLEIKRKLIPNDDLNNIHITFFGGEPTLLFDEIIKPTVMYAETKYPHMAQFAITTNGTLLNSERVTFLKDHSIWPLLSIDGNKTTQDFNRPCRDSSQSSFDLVEKNIPLLLDAFPTITFRSTIYQPTCGELFNNYVFAIERGFQSIFMCPNAREEWTEENIEILKNEIHKIFTYIETCFRLNIGMPIQNEQINKIFRNILEHDIGVFMHSFPELYIKRNVVRCGLGTGSASIAYNGLLFGCQEQDSRDTNDYFYIGDIYNGVDIKRHSKILSDYAEMAQIECSDKTLCSTCKLRKTCQHDVCPSVSHDMFNSFFIKPKIDCIFLQAMYDDALCIMHSLVQDNILSFKSYLDSIYTNYITKQKEGI